MPDYEWFDGCFGTATGNLMGYWNRHGFPNFYTGPTAEGVAPLDSFGDNYGIRSLWATKAGIDGRPSDQPGHDDDYFVSFHSTDPDPYVTAQRPEHTADCLGDFIGLNQKKWVNLNGECDGNVDGYAFVYWDASGKRRWNFTPGPEAGLPAIDIQSGLRSWTSWRGNHADVFTQLVDMNPETPPGAGFTFQDLKQEIDAGYPVLFFMQDVSRKSRAIPGMDRANPEIHALVVYGYFIADDGTTFVRFRSSFASGDEELAAWTYTSWFSFALPPRGVIGYHPLPQITSVERQNGEAIVAWDGPAGEIYDSSFRGRAPLHWYVVEVATSLSPPNFFAITQPTTDHVTAFLDPGYPVEYFRLAILPTPAR